MPVFNVIKATVIIREIVWLGIQVVRLMTRFANVRLVGMVHKLMENVVAELDDSLFKHLCHPY
jgi:hypothetical protein